MYDNERMLRDLEGLQTGSAPAPRRRRFLKLVLTIILALLAIYLCFYIKNYLAPNNKITWVDKIPILGQIKHLAQSSERQLKGEDRDRINILLLGIGGKGHDGAQLTDTIMVASIKPSTNQVSLLSIPRDLAVPVEGSGWRKINSINALAEANEANSGGLATSQAIGELLQGPIDYYVRIDFEGFQKIIDQVGGVDVYVDNTLDDYAYPILGQEDNPNYYSRYEHLHVDQGWQHMDGKLALKYARSRHGLGAEGSDFARAKRQQKIIEAVKSKVMTANFLLNPSQISSTFNTLSDNISTNLKVWEILKLWSFVKNVKSENIITKVLDNTPGGLLVDAKGDNGAYILNPRSGSFAEIQYLFNSIFGEENQTETKDDSSEKKLTSNVAVSVMNGTWVNGLGSREAVKLERLGVKVIAISNSSRRNFERSVIYDLTFGAKRNELEFLKEKTGANIAPTLPDWLKEELASQNNNPHQQPDFIIVLGTNADINSSGTENTN